MEHRTKEVFAVEKVEIRIVAGKLRGRKVACVVHPGLRPTPQMVREALFSILGNAVPDRVFFDIFAGSGVIGLEAISRGASAARLIEREPNLANDIQKSANQFGCADKVQVLRADAYRWAERWIPNPGEPVNLFLSPPFPDLDPTKLPDFLKLVDVLWKKCPEGSVLVIQAEDGFPVEQLEAPEEWDVRDYSRNVLLFRVKEYAVKEEVVGEKPA